MTLAVALVAVLVIAGAIASVRAGAGRPRGLAPGFDLVKTVSLAAARRKALHTRPGLTIKHRPTWLGGTPARQVGIELCRSGWRWLYASLEDVVLIFAEPRSWKTGLLSAHVVDLPGGGLGTSTRTDLYLNTVEHRKDQGPVRVFNPEGLGATIGVPNDARWDMVRGCDAPAEATMRAGYLLSGSASGDKVSDRGYWESNAGRALRYLLCAAALSGGSMHEVYEWGQTLSQRAPVSILKTNPGAPPGWGEALESLQAQDPKPKGSVSATLTLALQFMDIPELAYAATPGPGDVGLDVPAFILGGGFLYVIGTQREYAPLTPLFSALVGHVVETCKKLAGSRGRLDPPFGLILDEVYNTARLPLARISSELGGIGVPIVCAFQGLDQAEEMLGAAGAGTLWTNSAVRMGAGGSVPSLEKLSTLLGHKAQRNRRGEIERSPVLTASEIDQLDPGKAVVYTRGKPTIGTVRPIWERRTPRAKAPHPPTGPLAPVYSLDEQRRAGPTTEVGS